METVSWKDIPTLENISVDWDYEPDNPLGNRSWVRIGRNDLHNLLDVKNIPVAISSRSLRESGVLLDISPAGLAVLLPETGLTVGMPLNIRLALGRQRLFTRAVVRNIGPAEGQHRVGVQFLGPNKEDSSFIAGLISAKAYSY